MLVNMYDPNNRLEQTIELTIRQRVTMNLPDNGLLPGGNRRAVAIILLILLAAVNLPYLYGHGLAPAGKQFTGFFFYEEEGWNYLSKIEQGRAGHLLWRNLYTLEEQPPRLLFTFYTGLGLLAGAAGGSALGVFHLARLLCLLLLVWALHDLCARLFTDRKKIALALGITLFSSGWGFFYLAFRPELTANLPVDLWVPESNTFAVLFLFPHLALALAFLVRTLTVFLFVPEPAPRQLLLLAAGSLYWGCAAPYLLVLVVPVLFVVACLRKNGRLAARVPFFLALLPGFILFPYYYHIFSADAVLRAWQAQNALPTPPLLSVLGGYCFVIILALFSLPLIRKDETVRSLWLYVALNLAALYLPLGFQRRLITGLHIPLAILCAYGAFRIGGELNRKKIAVLFLLLVPGNLYLLANGLHHLNQQIPPYYVTRETAELLSRLKALPDDGGGVLADKTLSPLIPAFAGKSVYWGHYPETVGYHRKKRLLAAFYRGETPAAGFIRENGIRYCVLPNALLARPDFKAGFSELNPELISEVGDQGLYRVR